MTDLPSDALQTELSWLLEQEEGRKGGVNFILLFSWS